MNLKIQASQSSQQLPILSNKTLFCLQSRVTVVSNVPISFWKFLYEEEGRKDKIPKYLDQGAEEAIRIFSNCSFFGVSSAVEIDNNTRRFSYMF